MQDIDFYTNVARKGNDILVRGIRDGKDVRFKVPYEPTLYVEHHNDYGFKNVYGQNLKPITFDNIAEAQSFAMQHKGSNLKIYGFPYYHSQYTLENLSNSIDKFDKSKVRIFNIDIEVTSNEGFPDAASAAYPITACCIYDNIADKFVTFGIGEWEQSDSILPEDIADKVVYIGCETEVELLERLLDYWNRFTPNIVTGWNIEFFDIPYIHNRLKNLGFDQRKLSPWLTTNIRVIQTARGEEQACTLLGIDIIDYIDRYRKTYVRDSYRLDNIASIELGERKSLSTVAMLDMSRVPYVDKPAKTKYEANTNDEEFNRFARLRNERVNLEEKIRTGRAGDNADLELELLLKQERKAAFQGFISYNIQDVNLVKRLDERLGLLDVQMMVAYTTSVNYEEVSGSVRTWDCLINKELWKENIIPHFHVNPPDQKVQIPGGYVKEPQLGKHGWCMSFDLNSLYPHLIMQFNISPDTIEEKVRVWPVDGDEQRVEKILNREAVSIPKGYENHSISASGTLYSNDHEGIIPRIMRSLYDERKKAKKQMIEAQKRGDDYTSLHLKQFAIKILLNSGYGALTNKYYRWYDRRMGESITLSGQMVIRSAEKAINKWMNKLLKTDNKDYVIAIDTDSNYVNMQPLVDHFFANKSHDELVDILDKIAQDQIQKVLDKEFDDLKEYLQAYDQKMVMEREAIASSAFWTAKKRYAMCVWDMEGVRMPSDKPKLKIQGLEAIRSSTPAVCREPLLNLIEKVLLTDEDTVQKYIADFKKQFMSFDVSDIAMPRTINNLRKYHQAEGFMKGTPPHVRGAIVFNKLLKQYKLDSSWENMKESEKGKFIYLREPNNIGTDVISFNTSIPEEFDCLKYVDKEKMFEKVIVDPVTGILNPIGWSVEKKLTLESFFG